MSAKPAEAAPVAPKSSSKVKLIVIGLLAVVVAGAGAGGAWYYLGSKKHETGDEQVAAPEHTTPTYLALENMVVNLADPGGERVAQVGITLDLDSDKTVSQVKQLMPAIRSRVLMLVSQRSSEELFKRDGKEKLADDIAVEVSRSLGHEDDETLRKTGSKKSAGTTDEPDERPVRRKRRATPSPVNGVLFSSFIVQ